MVDAGDGPTLTDSVGLGGVIAQEGFDYQIWEGLARLPGWLGNPAFEAMMFEGLEDIEARFFAPHAPMQCLLERYQAKSGSLTPQEVCNVFMRFLEFENRHPRATRVHTLVIPQLPATLKWVTRDAERVRRARPFYAPFDSVRAASDAKLAQDMVAQFGEPLGQFVADGVEVTERPLPSRDAALQSFGLALATAFPALDISARQTVAAFDALAGLARRSIGKPLSRAALIAGLERAIQASLSLADTLPLHVRSDRNGVRDGALEIDASAFSGGSTPFPDPGLWRDGLVSPLDAAARWLNASGVSRVALSGSYRLTTALILGWVFRSSKGFELEIPTREGQWSTDDRPDATDDAGWEIASPAALEGGELVVSVGVLRRPSDDLVAGGARAANVLDCFFARPMTSAKEAQAGAARVKAAVAAAAARLRPEGISLYYAGPAAFAVVLGHRWNAMPPTTLHEFQPATRSYMKTASI